MLKENTSIESIKVGKVEHFVNEYIRINMNTLNRVKSLREKLTIAIHYKKPDYCMDILIKMQTALTNAKVDYDGAWIRRINHDYDNNKSIIYDMITYLNSNLPKEKSNSK